MDHRRHYRVKVTGVPVARSAIIDLGSELELHSVRLHYQYDIHTVTRDQERAFVLISYLHQPNHQEPPGTDPVFVNIFKFTGPLPPPDCVLGPALAPPNTLARYIRVQAIYTPCMPLNPLTQPIAPAWRVVEITAASVAPSSLR